MKFSIIGIDQSLSCTAICVRDVVKTNDKFVNTSTNFYFTTDRKKYKTSECVTPILIKKAIGFERVFSIVSELKNLIEIIRCSDDERNFVAIEGYSFNSKGSGVFQLGELGGSIKMAMVNLGYGLRVYTPASVKKYATGLGNGDKLPMFNQFKSLKEQTFDPQKICVEYGNIPDTPLSDLIDSFFISELLMNEIILRHACRSLSEYDLKKIEVFNSVNKNGQTVLVEPFFRRS